MSKPKVEIREVTPEWAAEILAKHDASIESGEFKQRPINHKAVSQYAIDMKSGNWALTGQGISFDEEGHLMDGQHRLAAVVKAGVSVPMLIMWDLPVKVEGSTVINTQDLYDIGKKRTVQGQLAIHGFKYYADMGSAARCLLILAQGNTKNNYSLPAQVAVANLLKHNMTSIMEIITRNNPARGRYRGCIIAPLTLLHTADRTMAELFATEYNELADLGKTSPVLHFIKFLERPAVSTSGTDYQIKVMSALSSALYNYAEEKRVELIRGNQDHVNWLLKVASNAVKKIKEVSGATTTIEELTNRADS